MVENKRAFIIIFHRYYFYAIGIPIALFFIYGHLVDNGIISEDNFIGDILKINPRNITLIELEVHRLVNERRIINGLSALEYNGQISSRSRLHSQDMADNDFFEHDNLMGIEMGENIAMTPIGDVISCGNVYDETKIADCTVEGWMNSPGHRENILTSRFYCEGIGVAVSDSDEVYITQKFC